MINSGLSEQVISKINTVFAKHMEVEQVLLYGSRAKGNYREASDIDLSLLGEKLNLTLLQKIEGELDDLLLPYKFDLSIFHQIKSMELIAHINRVGKLFYQRSN